MDEEIKEMISKKASVQLIKEQAIKNGMKTILQDGISKAKSGITTLNEVLRVTG